nr:MAG TPA: hypothetical protein [Bacteriophage sp.]
MSLRYQKKKRRNCLKFEFLKNSLSTKKKKELRRR